MTLSKAAKAAAAVGVLGAIAGCAGNQAMPSASIDRAEQRLDEADRAEAQQYANRELNMAREKLVEAREAQQEGDEERAARLAEHAELDAVYATAVADNQEVQAAVQELRDSLDTLQSEIERQSGFGNQQIQGEQPSGLQQQDSGFQSEQQRGSSLPN